MLALSHNEDKQTSRWVRNCDTIRLPRTLPGFLSLKLAMFGAHPGLTHVGEHLDEPLGLCAHTEYDRRRGYARITSGSAARQIGYLTELRRGGSCRTMIRC